MISLRVNLVLPKKKKNIFFIFKIRESINFQQVLKICQVVSTIILKKYG